jgi:hypothetical protein
MTRFFTARAFALQHHAQAGGARHVPGVLGRVLCPGTPQAMRCAWVSYQWTARMFSSSIFPPSSPRPVDGRTLHHGARDRKVDTPSGDPQPAGRGAGRRVVAELRSRAGAGRGELSRPHDPDLKRLLSDAVVYKRLSGGRRSNLGITTMPMKKVSITTPSKTTIVTITAPLVLWTSKRCGPEARSRGPRLGAGGLGVEQGVHA